MGCLGSKATVLWGNELDELKQARESDDPSGIRHELGDLLFSVVNAARLYNIEPETALEKTNRKFIRRFQYLELKANEMGRSLKEMSLEEMEAIWQEAKSR